MNKAGAKVLVIEAHERLRNTLFRSLTFYDYDARAVPDLKQMTALQSFGPEIIILDATQPDSPQLTERIREITEAPLIAIVPRSSPDLQSQLLNKGADDVIERPFAIDELVGRMQAILRRARPTSTPQRYTFADLVLDMGARTVQRGDRVENLTSREADMMLLLMQHPRQVISRDDIYLNVWGDEYGRESNIIEVYIRYLRRKTEREGQSRLIHTVRNVGYVLREAVDTDGE